MSDSLNNKELVAVCHELAKALNSDTPIIDIAKILSRLADRLDVTTAALRETEKQRDTADQAERVWEKTMMEVCGEDGPASVANEIRALQGLRDTAMQALKSQVELLAAENAGLKTAAEFATASDMWEELGGNVMRYQYQEWYADKLKAAMQTPATAAFLAEVLAQGVEMFAGSLKVVGGQEHPYSAVANEFAAQLRKGAQS